MTTNSICSAYYGLDSALWRRLSEYTFDNPDASLSLRDRLARDNDWSLHYADNVLDEYRRFVYLAVVAGHPVTPSEDVDQAWHLHLLYTQEYWEHFCPEVLGHPLHHGPTRGGAAEGDKFTDWYSKTLESYRHIFNSEPPVKVWPSVRQRFEGASLYRRINIGTHFVVPKRRLRSALNAAGLLGSVLLVTRIALANENGESSPGTLLAISILTALSILAIILGCLAYYKSRRRKQDQRIKRDGKTGGQSIVIAGCGASATTAKSGNSETSADSGDGGGGCGGGCGGG